MSTESKGVISELKRLTGINEFSISVSSHELSKDFYRVLELYETFPTEWTDCLDSRSSFAVYRVGLRILTSPSVQEAIMNWAGNRPHLEVLAGKLALGQSLLEKAPEKIYEALNSQSDSVTTGAVVLAGQGLQESVEEFLRINPITDSRAIRAVCHLAKGVHILDASTGASDLGIIKWQWINDQLTTAGLIIGDLLDVKNMEPSQLTHKLDLGAALFQRTNVS